MDFVQTYHAREAKGAEKLPLAAEACISTKDIWRQIEDRLQKLQDVAASHKELSEFLEHSFLPTYNVLRNHTSKTLSLKQQEQELDSEFRTLSPSDFGFHNALRQADQSLVWLDFEYFGWDDPVKVICDFWWHPGFKITSEQKEFGLKGVIKNFSNDDQLIGRFNYCLPIYGLRWG